MKQSQLLGLTLVLASMLALTSDAEAGRIVLANDEWTLSDFGGAFTAPNDAGVFAQNVASWFTGGGSGTFHAYSTNFGLTGASLSGALTSAGHSWTTGTGITWDLPTLQTYDGIFLAANAVPDINVLIAYVNGGGNVYLAGGTGCCGGAFAEAGQWNPFLNAFGLGLGAPYNGVGGNVAISSLHPIFTNVDSLFQDNGNDSLDINVLDPRGVVLISSGGRDLYAVFESAAAVPEPGTLVLLGAGLAAIGALKRRRS